MAPRTFRALIVEDEPSSRHLLQEILAARGHTVDACDDAESAWSTFQRHRHPLVVLDWKLPGMDGLELCKRIREAPAADETFILFVTGLDRRDALERALEAGASDYLSKAALPDQIHVRLAIAERQLARTFEHRDHEEELVRDALHDPLTGLANRSLFLERLDRAARRSERLKSHLFAVMAVNLRGFDRVNAQHGRRLGDRVLVEAARRLEGCVRDVDTVGRIEGDEFVILLDGMNHVSDPARVSERVHQEMARPFHLDDGEATVGISIGMAVSVSGFKASSDLFLDALQALERAKEEAPGSDRMFDPVVQAKAVARLQLERRLRRALDEGQMVLHYQPVVSLDGGAALGVEALVRWNDPERGLVQPEEFLPVAVETGLDIALGRWVLKTSLADLAGWRSRVALPEGFGVSVNFSGRQFSEPDIVDEIEASLAEHGLPGQALHVEVTEDLLMSDAASHGRTLERLDELGVQLHVDDFGTGYSSMSYLCLFPIDALKIDASFVSRMTRGQSTLEVVRTIVRLGRNLGMLIIAEGVETDGQRELLLELGCHAAQGWLFSRPLAAHQVVGWMSRAAAT
ncbi:MAG: EAL domain-containing protein [Gemmatimonadetes bacterium]|nr:EAL domain-containing protein [Gemmatimonadota bacterium]